MAVFRDPIETTYGPLRYRLDISLHRHPRQRCSACGKRRILYSIGLGDDVGPALCAKDAGIR